MSVTYKEVPMWLVIFAVFAVLLFGVVMYGGPGVQAVTSVGQSDFRIHADRIAVIRAGGSGGDGIHLLSDPLKISEDDYLLMGCDNSTTTRNFPDVPRETRSDGRWFAGGSDLTQEHAGFNNHQAQRKDGTWEIEAFYTSLPAKQYQASPEEVAWHYIRVKALRAQNVPGEQRKAMLTEEAKGKPWEQMR